MAKTKTKTIKRKPKREISVLETAFVRWAVDRDNPVCLLFDIIAAGALIYGLWYHNLYAILVGIVSVVFGHSISRSKQK